MYWVLLFKKMHALKVCLCHIARGMCACNNKTNEPEIFALRGERTEIHGLQGLKLGKLVNDIMTPAEKGRWCRKKCI